MPDVTVCGICDLEIDLDDHSIQCDICQSWVHTNVKCSKLRKTVFKLMNRVDWVCSSCIDFGRRCRVGGEADVGVGLMKLQEEINEVRSLNYLLFEENKTLNNKINNLKSVISVLKSFNKKAKDPNSSGAGEVGGGPVLGPGLESGCGGVGVSGAGPAASGSACLAGGRVSGLGETLQHKSTQTVFDDEPSSVFVRSRQSGSGPCKVKLFADSRGRGLRDLIQTKLKEPEVVASFYPSAPMPYYVDSLVVESSRSGLDPENCVCLLMGGVNDTSDRSVDECIQLLEKNAGKLKNLVIVETPYRYDRRHLNKSIEKQNDRLKELCGRLKWKFLSINFALSRMHYTRQGLHLNKLGKQLVSDLISNALCTSHFLVC